MNFDPVTTTSKLPPLATNEFPPIGSPHIPVGEIGVAIAGCAGLSGALTLLNNGTIPAFTLMRDVNNATSVSDLIMVNYPSWVTLSASISKSLYTIITYTDDWIIEAGSNLPKIVATQSVPSLSPAVQNKSYRPDGIQTVQPLFNNNNYYGPIQPASTVYTVLFITSVTIAPTLPAAGVVMVRAFYNLLA